MNFNEHSRLEGQHAFLGASKYHWINYTDEKLEVAYTKHQAAQMGSRLHEFACECINLGIKLPKIKKTLNMYVNDAIGFRMTPEQPLYYSDNCFGTCDTIAFKKNFLRIHDFKSGETPSSIKQLEVYTAIFCLEYGFKPKDIEIELRLYQLDEILIHNPFIEDICYIMDKIIIFDKQIDEMKIGG